MIVRYLYLMWLQHRLRRFRANAQRMRGFQHRALLRKIAQHADSDFGRAYGFSSIRTAADFRRQVPILTYDDHQPYIERVLHGDVTALFAPDTQILMFAMTSGTTGEPKRLPITAELFREYKTGWRMWAAGVYGDHFALLTSKTLQLTSDWQQYACAQRRSLRPDQRPGRFDTARDRHPCFCRRQPVARIHDSAAKHYTSLRFALATRRIGMIITANPSTLDRVRPPRRCQNANR